NDNRSSDQCGKRINREDVGAARQLRNDVAEEHQCCAAESYGRNQCLVVVSSDKQAGEVGNCQADESDWSAKSSDGSGEYGSRQNSDQSCPSRIDAET